MFRRPDITRRHSRSGPGAHRRRCACDEQTHAVILTGAITNPDGSHNHIETEGDTLEEARENLYALLGEGQHDIAIRTHR